MKISDLQQEFKRYILTEKGLKNKTYKAIVATLKMLHTYAHTEEISHLTEGLIREFLYQGREEKGWEAKTFHNHWQNLKGYFDWLIKKESSWKY